MFTGRKYVLFFVYYISVQEICWNKEQYIFDIHSLMRSKICILTPKNLLL